MKYTGDVWSNRFHSALASNLAPSLTKCVSNDTEIAVATVGESIRCNQRQYSCMRHDARRHDDRRTFVMQIASYSLVIFRHFITVTCSTSSKDWEIFGFLKKQLLPIFSSGSSLIHATRPWSNATENTIVRWIPHFCTTVLRLHKVFRAKCPRRLVLCAVHCTTSRVSIT